MRRTRLLIVAIFVAAASFGQAQSLPFNQTEYHRHAVNMNGRAEFRFELFSSGAGSRSRRIGFTLMPPGGVPSTIQFSLVPMAAGPNLQVLGGGTLGRLTKWTGFTSSNSFIGNSTIFEDKFGMVGIGTDSPTSKLTVAGTIESLSGGFKFPDGTIQTTAGIAPNEVVRSLNGLKGDVTLAAGANITITPFGSGLTIAASGLLGSVAHDATLTGDGTVASPLGVSVPLNLTGSSEFNEILLVTNTGDGGRGMTIQAGDGGPNSLGFGGTGLSVQAGAGVGNGAGTGVVARGGNSDTFGGGTAVRAIGGSSDSGPSGEAVNAIGGSSSGTGSGGDGVIAVGGDSVGPGKAAGDGIIAIQGFGHNVAADGLAGIFTGKVEINGSLNVSGTKNFKIDHPFDPENKYLYHAAVESAEVLNVYSGNTMLDANGEAIVHLPEWLQAINRDFRYSLTPIGAPASGLYIAQEITNDHFKIAGGVAGMKVSWQVTGVRSDRALLKQPFKAEQDKPERERGTYVNPEAFDQPAERGLEWARYPELMPQIKARREEMKRKNANRGNESREIAPK